MKIMTVITILIGVIIIFFATILIIDVIFFNDKPKAGLLLSASREGSLGGIRLGLYDDKHFEIGSLRGNVNTTGVYTFVNDTLKLFVHKGKLKLVNNGNIYFIISDGMLVETSKPDRIKFLEIIENELTNSPY